MNKNKLAAKFILFIFIMYRYVLMWFRINNTATDFIIISAVIMSIVLLFGKKIKKSEINFILFMLTFIIISYIHGRTIDIIISLIIAIFYMNIDKSIENFIKDFTFTSALFYLITLFLHGTGILEQVASSRYVNGVIDVRNSLGFIHVNATFMYFIPIFLGILYINKSKNRKHQIFALIILDIISIILYSLSLCRTGMMIVIIINAMLILKKYISNSKICDFLAKYAYLYMPILLILLYKFTATDFSNYSINKLLSFRPYYINQALNTYKFKLFGNNITNDFIIDCSYIKILLNFGVLSYFIFSYINIKSYDYLKTDFYLKLIYLSFIIYQVFENNYLYQTNFLMVIQLLILMKTKAEKEQSNENFNNNSNV